MGCDRWLSEVADVKDYQEGCVQGVNMLEAIVHNLDKSGLHQMLWSVCRLVSVSAVVLCVALICLDIISLVL